MRYIQVAIDGPAGSGKSTVAKLIAERLKITYLDTGAMYRAVTFQCLRRGLNPENSETLKTIVDEIELDMSFNGISINGEDCSEAIRTPKVSQNVSNVAKDAYVRTKMVALQQKIAEGKSVVMDGRDIGTHVLPKAAFKYFLVASSIERARRRIIDLEAKGFKTTVEELAKEIEARDKIDSEREVSPLMQAEDAIRIDTTSLSIDEVVGRILDDIKKSGVLDE